MVPHLMWISSAAYLQMARSMLLTVVDDMQQVLRLAVQPWAPRSYRTDFSRQNSRHLSRVVDLDTNEHDCNEPSGDSGHAAFTLSNAGAVPCIRSTQAATRASAGLSVAPLRPRLHFPRLRRFARPSPLLTAHSPRTQRAVHTS